MADSNGFSGQIGLNDNLDEHNLQEFHVRQQVAQIRTAVPVKVMGISSDGNSVHVQPLNSQIDGAGNTTPHGTVYNIPIHHMSGGNGTFKVSPVKGDMGHIIVCDRDISAVKANAGPASPASFRQHNLSDGIYMGGFGNINGTPKNSAIWGTNGLTITVGSASYVFGSSGLTVNGTITATQNITAGQGGGDSVTLQNHTHAGGPKPDAGT